MFEKIKEAYRKYNQRIIREAFDESVSTGDYGGAIHLAERNCKKNGFTLTGEDVNRLRDGLNEDQIKLKSLEAYVK